MPAQRSYSRHPCACRGFPGAPTPRTRPPALRRRPPELKLQIGRARERTLSQARPGATLSLLWDPKARLGSESSAFGVAGDAGCAGAEFPLPQAGYTPGWVRLGKGVAGAEGRSTRRSPRGAPPRPRWLPPFPSLIFPAPAGMGVWSREPAVASSFAPRSRERSNARSLFPRDTYLAVRPSLLQAVWPPGTLRASPRLRDSVRGPLSAPLVAAADPRWAACGTTTR